MEEKQKIRTVKSDSIKGRWRRKTRVWQEHCASEGWSVRKKKGKGGWGLGGRSEGYCLIGELALLAKPPLTSATRLRSV